MTGLTAMAHRGAAPRSTSSRWGHLTGVASTRARRRNKVPIARTKKIDDLASDSVMGIISGMLVTAAEAIQAAERLSTNLHHESHTPSVRPAG